MLLTDPAIYDRLCRETLQRLFRTWDDYGHDIDSVLKIEPAVVG